VGTPLLMQCQNLRLFEACLWHFRMVTQQFPQRLCFRSQSMMSRASTRTADRWKNRLAFGARCEHFLLEKFKPIPAFFGLFFDVCRSGGCNICVPENLLRAESISG